MFNVDLVRKVGGFKHRKNNSKDIWIKTDNNLGKRAEKFQLPKFLQE